MTADDFTRWFMVGFLLFSCGFLTVCGIYESRLHHRRKRRYVRRVR